MWGDGQCLRRKRHGCSVARSPPLDADVATICEALGTGDRAEGRLWPCSAPPDGSDGVKLTNRTMCSFAAKIVVGEIALSGAIQTGPQAFYGAFYKN